MGKRRKIGKITFLFLGLVAQSLPASAISTSYCLRTLIHQAVFDDRATALLDNYFRGHSFTALQSLEEARVLAKYFGILEAGSFPGLSDRMKLKYYNAVFVEIAKAPREVVEAVLRRGRTLDLVLNDITDHADYRGWRGTRPAYWSSGTWEDVAGLGGPKHAVAAVNRLDLDHHGSVNLILHEYAHTYEMALDHLLSEDPDFLAVWEKDKTIQRRGRANRYLDAYAHETFAEGFAMYFDSPATREKMRGDRPALYDYFANRFPDSR